MLKIFAIILVVASIAIYKASTGKTEETKTRKGTVTICDVEFDGEGEIYSYRYDLPDPIVPYEYIIAKRSTGFLLGGQVVDVYEVDAKENHREIKNMESIWAKLNDETTKEAIRYNKRYAKKHGNDDWDIIDDLIAYDALFGD